jgi:pyruvate/2-oxoglutarate dehydrogenase complex dihydrolipoamide acyltransferase (E2) component
MKNADQFETVALPKTRRAIRDMLREGKRKHLIHALLEIDVTLPRQKIKEMATKSGTRLSFTAFIIYCLGQVVDEHQKLHSYRNWRNQLIIFDEVDVNMQIERDVGGRKWVMPYIVRAANRKSLLEIHQEIRSAQVKEIDQAREFKQYEWYLLLPGFMRRFFWWIIGRSPQITKRVAGTVGVTAVGMFGKGGGWGIPITTQTLLLTLGGIAKKPGVVDSQIMIREYLSLTATIDHDIVDGAPAARFLNRLQELIESGHGF